MRRVLLICMKDAMTAPAPRRKNNAWIWFFVLMAVASVGVAGFMIWFNRHLQLRPEQLQAALQRWQEHGPASYRLTYTRRLGDSDHTDTFVVKVRHRKVVEVRMNGEPLRDEDGLPITDERLQYHSMDRLLRDVERFLELDARDGRTNYNVAFFDEDTGALRKYVRRVMGTRERVEEEAKVEPLTE
ncbi:MAG: hypothetical protein JO021_23040 [Alphaproteobacteria bacterium]|nr:hypothetical protein [Alphaproteobacteria bacterium]